jgi:predicted Kef-type K+ transport protein
MNSSMQDLLWISPALLAGTLAGRMGLPPMVGYLICGFALNLTGVLDFQRLTWIGDLGVTLLLFTVGLKLDFRSLLRARVWLGTSIHSLLVTSIFALLFYGLSIWGLQAFAGLTLGRAALVGFALSFSSTVFAVKTLEDKGDYRSNYGQLAIGMLIMQDIFAVIFLAFSTGKLPSAWALILVLLIPGRFLLMRLLDHAGHNAELQILYGITLAFGSFALFDALGVKGDLGALVVGALLASHSCASHVSERLMGFKDLLLVGFFLSIGLSGQLSLSSFTVAIFLAILVSLKSFLFFAIFTRFRMRARTAVLSTLSLSNYSEFGLIVGAVSVSKGWLTENWLITIALAMALTVVVAAPLNLRANRIYESARSSFQRFETQPPLPEDLPPDLGDAELLVVGMGRLGTTVYDQLVNLGYRPVGVDNDAEVVANHRSSGRQVSRADANDKEFWDYPSVAKLKTVIVTFPTQKRNLCIVTRALEGHPEIDMFAVANYDEEIEELKAAGARAAWNLFSEAGMGLTSDIHTHLQQTSSFPPRSP